MKNYDAEHIRNVLLAGHGGSGKTTLLEAMAFTAGAVTRMGTVEDGNTISDHEPEEVKKGIAVQRYNRQRAQRVLTRLPRGA